MYVLRKLIEHKLRTSGLTDDDAYICSLSSRTIVYKGQLTPAQARPAPARALDSLPLLRPGPVTHRLPACQGPRLAPAVNPRQPGPPAACRAHHRPWCTWLRSPPRLLAPARDHPTHPPTPAASFPQIWHLHFDFPTL